VVNRDVIAKDRASAGSPVCAEHLMMKLAPLVGRGQAHDIVHYALESGRTDALYTDSNLIAHFSESPIRNRIRPFTLSGGKRGDCSPLGHPCRRHSNSAKKMS